LSNTIEKKKLSELNDILDKCKNNNLNREGLVIVRVLIKKLK
jgi:hypothetical protein